MKILYGVVGAGMGHAIRSKVIIEHLSLYHDVHIVASHNACSFLAEHFPNTHRIWGLDFVMGAGKVNKGRTAARFLRGLISGGIPNLAKMIAMLATEHFDAVISDFESFSHLYGKLTGTPVITIDNLQAMGRFTLDKAFDVERNLDYTFARMFTRLKGSGAFYHLVTSFFEPQGTASKTAVIPPILRPEIIKIKPENLPHLLVYQTSASNPKIKKILKKLPLECRCYGFVPNQQEIFSEDNLTFMPFDESRFIEDLRTCSGVITSSGFTLLGEAFYLGKPVLTVPLGNQAEQTLNAWYVQNLGYGLSTPSLDAQSINCFIRNLPQYRNNLKSFPRQGNTQLFKLLDNLLYQVFITSRAKELTYAT